MKAAVSPEAVGESFHSPFGQTVSSSNQRQSAQNTGHIYHPALGLLQQRQKLERHINYSDQIHIQNLCEIFQLHPLCRTDGNWPASVIHQTPQTCRCLRLYSPIINMFVVGSWLNPFLICRIGRQQTGECLDWRKKVVDLLVLSLFTLHTLHWNLWTPKK